ALPLRRSDNRAGSLSGRDHRVQLLAMPKLRDTLGLLQRRRGRDSGGCVHRHLCLERQERGFPSLRELRVRDALAAARLLAGATRRERQPDAARADCRMPGAEGGWREPRTAADLNRNAQPQAREFSRRRARDNARRTRGRAGRRGDLSITGLLGVSWSRERRVRATPGAHLLGPAVQRGGGWGSHLAACRREDPAWTRR